MTPPESLWSNGALEYWSNEKSSSPALLNSGYVLPKSSNKKTLAREGSDMMESERFQIITLHLNGES